MTESYHDLEALASNPHTDWDVLHWIAENHPELRAVVAANPGAYQELVDALGAMGDPEIDAAIAQREAAGGVGAPEADQQDLAEAELAAVEPASPPPPEPQPDDPAEKRGLPLLPIAAVVLALIGVGAVIGLLMLLLGGDEDQPAADEPPETQPTQAPAEEETEPQEPEADATEPEETAPEETGDGEDAGEEALAQARTAVEELGEDPSCETGEDAGVVGAFLAAGTEDDFPSDQDAALLESTFESIQSQCSPTEAAAIFEAARSGPQAPEEGQGAALNTVGTDWVTRSINDLRGAEQVSSFTAQGGNVECEFSDGLTCTVYSTVVEPCDEGATYRMTVEGVEVDCGAHLESGDREESLSADEAATDGFLVCQELSDRLTCFNTLELFGFEMSNTGHYTW